MIEPTDLRIEPAERGAAPEFETFFRGEYDRLFRALYLLCGDLQEADDLAQESLLRAYERWDRVSSMDSPVGYVYRTALNLHRSHLRKLAVRARRVFASVPEEDASAVVTARQDVQRALAKLPWAQREVIVLVEWLELTSEEVGSLIGIDASSVRGRLHRARAALRESLGGTDE